MPALPPQSLWPCLHDGEILAVRSDRLARTVQLEIDVAHLRPETQTGPEAHFFIHLQGVQAALVQLCMMWPGNAPIIQGQPMEEQNQLVREFWDKARFESMGWDDFVASFPDDILDISDASFESLTNSCELKLEGHLNGDRHNDIWCTVALRAESLTITEGENTLTLDEFIQRGQDYWDAFGNR